MQPSELIPPAAPKPPPAMRRRLTEEDAIDVWIARWLRVRRKDLCHRFQCDPRRLYEIWEGTRHPAARGKAWALFEQRFPGLVDRIDAGLHQRISRAHHPSQLGLFDNSAMQEPQPGPRQNKNRT